uniref:Zinc transporter 6ic n=1 Tax=Rhizophora mucronata TaxID=61149 RepID=A0A2P2JGP7_RHIMU
MTPAAKDLITRIALS